MSRPFIRVRTETTVIVDHTSTVVILKYVKDYTDRSWQYSLTIKYSDARSVVDG